MLGVGVLYLLLIVALMWSASKNRTQEVAENIVILGAQVRGTPAVPSPVLKERLDAALVYFATSPNATIIVCGGKGLDESATEAHVMAKYLKDHGIEGAHIVEEDTSTRTRENLENAKPRLSSGKTVIITNDYHMYRAKMLADRIGISEVEEIGRASCRERV